MSKHKKTRYVVTSFIFLVLVFVIFFYIIPIYNVKNRDKVIGVITTAIDKKAESELNELLLNKADAELVDSKKIDTFIQYVSANANNKVVSEFISSDDIIISSLNENSEAKLVLSQKGIFSKWTIVNILFLKR